MKTAPLVLLLLGGVLSPACNAPRDAEESELATEEVPPPPDAQVDLSDDPKERRAAEGMSGVLPGDFPSSLPVFEPSTITDIGEWQGRRAVTFLTPEPRAAVEDRYPGRLRAAGWSRVDASGETTRWRRGDQEVAIAVHADGAGTEIVVSY